jgi:hypothetical protein
MRLLRPTLIVLLCASPGRRAASAQDTTQAPRLEPTEVRASSRYRVGFRSVALLSTMRLSSIDPAFDDLHAVDATFAHSSSLFFLRNLHPHTWAGVETFFGNSYNRKDTGMQIQGAGAVGEVSTLGTWQATAGIQVGGVIVSATSRNRATSKDGVSSGTFYKGSGLFAAPYVMVGRERGKWTIGLVVKRALFAPGTTGLNRFSSTYGGVSVSRGL